VGGMRVCGVDVFWGAGVGGGEVAIQYVEPHALLECGASVCFEF